VVLFALMPPSVSLGASPDICRLVALGTRACRVETRLDTEAGAEPTGAAMSGNART